jgi:hypothetical protein
LWCCAFARAEPRTGVDFYLLVASGTDVSALASYDLDHQSAVGLEVSGIDQDSEARMNERIRLKVRQIRQGKSPDRAIAGIVGFRGARVMFRTAKP